MIYSRQNKKSINFLPQTASSGEQKRNYLTNIWPKVIREFLSIESSSPTVYIAYFSTLVYFHFIQKWINSIFAVYNKKIAGVATEDRVTQFINKSKYEYLGILEQTFP